jgi:hypothetical protein
MNKRISLNSRNWLSKDFYGEDWRGSHLPGDFAAGCETLAEVTVRALANRTSSNEHWSI